VNEFISITEIPGKSLGVISNKFIPAGTVIIEEEPIIYGYTLFNYKEKIQQATPEQRRKIITLHNCYKDSKFNPILGTLKTNGLSMGCGSEFGVLCEKISRFNHSCISNCRFYWHNEGKVERIITLVDVEPNVELTISYMNPALPWAERKNETETNFGFTCNCERCEKGPDSAEEKLIKSFSTKLDMIPSLLSSSARKCFEAIDSCVNFIYDHPDFRDQLPSLMYDAVQLCSAYGDVKGVQHYAKMYQKCASKFCGPNSEEEAKAIKLVRNPRSHRLWQSLHGSGWKARQLDIASHIGL